MLTGESWSDNEFWREIVSARHESSGLKKLGENPLAPLYGPCLPAGTGADRFVMAQLGQSLDGRIATPTGHSHYINGPSALVHLHRLRALSDAVIIGVGTALADNPRLSVRHATGENPARVIIDPNGRLSLSETCLQDDGSQRIVLTTPGRERRVAPDGVEMIAVRPGRDGLLDPLDIVEVLAEAGLKRLLIEGGAYTVSSFITANAVDRLHLLFGPMIIGSGPVGLNLPEISTLTQAITPGTVTYGLPEGDILVDCSFD